MTRRHKTSDHAQNQPGTTLTTSPTDPETVENQTGIGPNQSRNAREAITLALRARNESRRVRTLERLERRYGGWDA